MKLVLTIALVVAPAWGQSSPKVTLEYATHSGHTVHYEVKWGKNEIYVGKKKLSSLGIAAGFAQLQTILKVQDRKYDGCSAGVYVHKVIQNGKIKKEAGCVTQTEFDKKARAFRHLTRLAWRVSRSKE